MKSWEIEHHSNYGSIRSLDPILNNWIQVMRRYVRNSSYNDSPWQYNERATLGTLAAAGWAKGNVALEEFIMDKRNGNESYKGRCDLYISIGKQTFLCEAKQAWCNIGTRADSELNKASVVSMFKQACNDARKLPSKDSKGGDYRRLGICFAVPQIPISDKNKVTNLIEDWLEDIIKIKRSTDCITWFFPKGSRSNFDENRACHPGVVMIIREVK